MMEKYLKILGLNSNAALNDVKKAYRNLAKKNHPDRFVNAGQKKKQEEIMIKINEAYNRIIEYLKNNKNSLIGRPETDVNSIIETDYSLYKKGLEYYEKCYEGISKMVKHDLKDREENLKKAGFSFTKVIKEYPDSDWAFDSEEKLKKIEKLINSLEEQKNYNKGTQWTPKGTPKKDPGFYSGKFKNMFQK